MLTKSKLEQKIWKEKQEKQELPVFQTVSKYYAQADEYRESRSANPAAKYDDTVTCRIAKLMKKIKPRLKTHFFASKESLSIMGYSAKFKIACDTNNIYK